MFDCHICLADKEHMFFLDKDTIPLKAPSLYHSACRSLLTPFLAVHPPRKVAELWLHTAQHLAKESDTNAYTVEVSHTICRLALEKPTRLSQ